MEVSLYVGQPGGSTGEMVMAITAAERAEIEAVTKAWTERFNDRNAHGLSALYDVEAVLWGTLSPDIASTPEGVRGYFDAVCKSAIALTVQFGEQLIRAYGETMLNSGSYMFSFARDGQQQVIPARFSMTLRKRGDRWLIVDHHSSARPTAPQTQ